MSNIDPVSEQAENDPMDEALVMGIPRRELFSVSGFITKIDIDILTCVSDEHWFALPSQLASDVEAKEVRLGVIFARGDQVLIDEAGVLLHTASIPPEATALGEGLKALKELARISSERLLEADAQQLFMQGYLNDDHFVECRPYFIMIYEAKFADDTPAPDGMVWVNRKHLGDVALEPVSSLVADVVGGKT